MLSGSVTAPGTPSGLGETWDSGMVAGCSVLRWWGQCWAEVSAGPGAAWASSSRSLRRTRLCVSHSSFSRFAQLTDTEGLSRLAVLRHQRALVLCELDTALPRTLQALIDTDALDAVRAAVASAAGEVVAS